MVDPFSLAVAIGSFFISMVTLYLTYLRRGNLRLTRPTVLFFVRDGHDGKFKVVVTALLYSTAKRGHVVESMFIKITRDDSVATFGEWIYWDGGKVHLGGVKIGEEGRTLFDHFLLSGRTDSFSFALGKHSVEIYAVKVGAKRPLKLFQTDFILDVEAVEASRLGGLGFALIWNHDTHSHEVQIGPPRSHNTI
ncbi:MAG: hypothetical protein HZA82_01290 [Thaumarchaeota archaeon]|nr:hypothetical protein [Nitrososphaerota archaeon]